MSARPSRYDGYEVNGEKYQLPSPTLGKPLKLQEITGVLEPWPAHASGRQVPTSQIALTKSRELVVLNEQQSKLPNLVPKPRFLEQLERYIHKELHRHKVNEVAPSSLRLQIYREVFEWLIEAFKTYKPLLAEIKREYEMMLTHYRDEIRKMEPMKEMLWTLSQECDQRIMKIRDCEKHEIKALKGEKKQLEEKISGLHNEQQELLCQVNKLKEELSKEHKLYREEADARKLLIGDINELRSQQEDIVTMKQNNDVQQADDPVMLKLAYQQAKLAQSEVLSKLTKMEADYCDVIPRKDYEILLAQHTKVTENYDTTKSTLETLKSEYDLLREKFNEIDAQRETYSNRLQDLKRSQTPRPNWDRCSETVFGGEDRWKELSKDRTSDELVDVLLAEITGSMSEGNLLEPKGLEETIPKFLRHDQQVINRRMTKRDCHIHIRELWDERKVQKDEEATAFAKNQPYTIQPFNDFLDDFFRKIYAIPQIRIEWAYSFYDSLSRFSNDEGLTRFLGIINEEVDEETYWEEMRRMGGLMEHFKTVDKEAKEVLSRESFCAVLFSLHPSLDDQGLEQLYNCAKTELDLADGESIPYPKLFMSDDEGEYGPFLKEIRALINTDKNRYIDEIQKELIDMGNAKVSSGDVRRAFSIVDPQIQPTQLDAYLSWTFGGASDQLEMSPAVDVAFLVERLRNGNIHRVGPRT